MLTTCKHFDMVGNRCSRVTGGRCDEFPECEFKYIAELKAENERLRELKCKYKEYCTCNTEKYIQVLQEIKAIADARCDECKYGKDGISCKYGDCGEAKLHLITQLITKAEEE